MMDINLLPPPFIDTLVQTRTLARAKLLLEALADEDKTTIDRRCAFCGGGFEGSIHIAHEIGCPVAAAHWLAWELRDLLFKADEEREDATMTLSLAPRTEDRDDPFRAQVTQARELLSERADAEQGRSHLVRLGI